MAQITSSPTVKVDDNNDIGRDCYVLDLGIKLSKRYEEGPSSATEMARSVVITGQPGIGRNWVIYAVRRRLGEQKPFLLYQDGVCFLFVKDGVFEQDVKTVSARDFSPFLWAFIDADERLTGVPERLACHSANLYIMFTTSPERQRWKSLTKTMGCSVITMNPWFLEEIRLAAGFHGLTNEQQNLAEDTFKNLGPIPRICIGFVKDRSLLRAYERDCQVMIMGLTEHSLRHFVLKGVILDLDAESHTIFIIRRNEVDDLEEAYLEPISANVKMQLMIAIDTMQQSKRIDMYHAFASVTAARAVASLVYDLTIEFCRHIRRCLNTRIRVLPWETVVTVVVLLRSPLSLSAVAGAGAPAHGTLQTPGAFV
ncbi:hypothetical protein F5888DRAFT_1872903 [Russula emetica]|nr:hypothetical protein F5888DRAFT_1872903 [Russula emetica]